MSPANLIYAIEKNMFAWLPLFGNLPGGEYIDSGELKRSITPVVFGMFNSIMDARLPEAKVDQTIQEVIVAGRLRNVPLRWWIGPRTLPANLAEHLQRFGFVLADAAPGMAVERDKLNESRPKPVGVTVRLCKGEAEIRLWRQIMGMANEIPDEAAFIVEAWADFLINVDTGEMQPYLAWWDDQPAATCLLFLGGGAAGIYAVATIPVARRKGIGAWVTLYALLQARLMAPRLLSVGATQLNFLVTTSLASYIAGGVSALDYAWRVFTMPQVVIAQGLAVAALPAFATLAALGDFGQVRERLGDAAGFKTRSSARAWRSRCATSAW